MDPHLHEFLFLQISVETELKIMKLFEDVAQWVFGIVYGNLFM